MTDKFKPFINKKIIIAVPKGRILKELEPILKKVNIVPENSFKSNNNRKLMFTTSDKDIILIIVRSFDVVNFVAFGGAHIGIVGSNKFDYESEKIFASACIINNDITPSSNFRSEIDFEKWLFLNKRHA